MSQSFVLAFLTAFLINLTSLGQGNFMPDSTYQTVPKRQYTGWKQCQWVVPTSFFLTGSLIAVNKHVKESLLNKQEVKEERDHHFKHFSCDVDDYMQYSPNVVAIALSLSGVKGRNDLANQLAILIKTQLLLTSIIVPLKAVTREPRPDSNSKNSFPSGHTTEAFAAATFLSREYGHKNIWYSISAYTVATGVGAFRVLNNRHWISDVLAGAGIGILSTNIVYATHQHKWGKNHKAQLTVLPTYSNQSTGMYLSYKF